MIGDDDYEPPKEPSFMTGRQYADPAVLEEINNEIKALPGKWKFLLYFIIGMGIFYGGFQNATIAFGLTMIVMVIMASDADRRREALIARKRHELQNGLIREIYLHCKQ